MRHGAILALAAALAVPPPALAETIAQQLTAEFSYSLRNRIEDHDGFWFAIFELRGHAVPDERADRALALSCVGAAWGLAASLGGEETLCRLTEGTSVLYARLRSAEGTASEAALAFELQGGRGAFRGYAGEATALRAMDLTGEHPTGQGSLSLRLVLVPALNELE
jgi:hypothetical protein